MLLYEVGEGAREFDVCGGVERGGEQVAQRSAEWAGEGRQEGGRRALSHDTRSIAPEPTESPCARWVRSRSRAARARHK